MQKGSYKKKQQHMTTRKTQPGLEFRMDPKPGLERKKLKRKLFSKAAVITYGDTATEGNNKWQN